MRPKRRTALAAGLMTIFLGACAGSTPLPERPALPAAPVNFGRAVPLPAVKKGDSLKVVAAEHRAALHTANTRLDADRQFYERVQEEFGKAGE